MDDQLKEILQMGRPSSGGPPRIDSFVMGEFYKKIGALAIERLAPALLALHGLAERGRCNEVPGLSCLPSGSGIKALTYREGDRTYTAILQMGSHENESERNFLRSLIKSDPSMAWLLTADAPTLEARQLRLRSIQLIAGSLTAPEWAKVQKNGVGWDSREVLRATTDAPEGPSAFRCELGRRFELERLNALESLLLNADIECELAMNGAAAAMLKRLGAYENKEAEAAAGIETYAAAYRLVNAAFWADGGKPGEHLETLMLRVENTKRELDMHHILAGLPLIAQELQQHSQSATSLSAIHNDGRSRVTFHPTKAKAPQVFELTSQHRTHALVWDAASGRADHHIKPGGPSHEGSLNRWDESTLEESFVVGAGPWESGSVTKLVSIETHGLEALRNWNDLESLVSTTLACIKEDARLRASSTASYSEPCFQ